MINTLGSLSLIWLMLWFLLTLAFSLLYPLLRPLLMRLHPAHGSGLMLLYWAAPVFLAFLASLMLFTPMPDDLLISPHCHGSCARHAPQITEFSVAVAGLALAVLAATALLGNFSYNAWMGARMRRQFEALASEHNGYRLINAPQPVVFTLGWWEPRVFLSKGLLNQCSPIQLSVILGHEQAHRSRRDNLRLLLVRVFSLVLLPEMRKRAMHDIQILCEQACDFKAASKHGAIAVAETLVHVGRLVKNASLPQSSLAFNGGDLSIRVHALLSMDGRTNLRPWQLVIMVAVVAYILVLALDPLHHGAEWLIQWLDPSGLHVH
ncbi:MAG: M56 family metallopeptidase [Pseudohongiella sp.]|nr:M56 family metallopeptidase [Pseudohongiella sp.]